MKLGELKASINKYPPDMNDMEVMIAYQKNGRIHYEPLCSNGYLPMPGNETIVLGALSQIQHMVENGTLPKPEGYIPPENEDMFGDEHDWR